MRSYPLYALVLCGLLVGCNPNTDPTLNPGRDDELSSPNADENATMKITSTAFAANGAIPTTHTEDGDDVSPALAWSDVPSDARSLALICDDPDAPSDNPWVHWVIYNLPTTVDGIPEGFPAGSSGQLTAAVEGENSWGTTGYRGPAPPENDGTHHYHFKLYALDTELDLDAGATKEELLAAMSGHVLAQAEIVGTYDR